MTSPTLNVNVTLEHIRTGIQEDCHNCPVALAVWDAALEAGIHVEQVYIDGIRADIWSRDVLVNDPDHCYRLPQNIGTWITEYDMEPRAARPVTFELAPTLPLP